MSRFTVVSTVLLFDAACQQSVVADGDFRAVALCRQMLHPYGHRTRGFSLRPDTSFCCSTAGYDISQSHGLTKACGIYFFFSFWCTPHQTGEKKIISSQDYSAYIHIMFGLGTYTMLIVHTAKVQTFECRVDLHKILCDVRIICSLYFIAGCSMVSNWRKYAFWQCVYFSLTHLSKKNCVKKLVADHTCQRWLALQLLRNSCH